MFTLGIDIAKAKFDVALLVGDRHRSGSFSNTAEGFAQLLAWLRRYCTDPAQPIHACLEATGSYGIDLALFLQENAILVSLVNPMRVKAFAASEMQRNKTDQLDAATIARFCRAMAPAQWTPPAPDLRELRDLVRRCAALKDAHTQEHNRQQAGAVSAAVAKSIADHLTWLDAQIEAASAQVRRLIAANPTLRRNAELLRSIVGIGEVTAAVILAELPHLETFSPKEIAAFAGLSPQEHSPGTRRKRGQLNRQGSDRLRAAMFMGALSARRYNPPLRIFADRLAAAGKVPKAVIVAVARNLLVLALVVIKTQKPFEINHRAGTARA